MYIVKNALKSIMRSKGRNLLIGIIVLVIATASCLGLSIRNAAEEAREATLEGITITAQISVDRNSMMSDIMGSMGNMGSEGNGGRPSFDKDSFADLMGGMDGLSIDEQLKYAKLSMVKSFYYTISVSMNGGDILYANDETNNDEINNDESNDNETSDGETGDSEEDEAIKLEPVSTSGSGSSNKGDGSTSSGSSNKFPSGDFGGMGGMPGFQLGTMGTQGDFTLVGYSSDEAMTDFINGTTTITSGVVFEEGTDKYECIISDELATYNNLVVGDKILVVNPNNEEETYELEIVGIYHNSQSTVTNSGFMQGFATGSDPANQIYLSSVALNDILTKSSENAEESTDEDTGITTTTALPSQESGTYVFATLEDYEEFCEKVYEEGLSEKYTVSSSDITQYENSLLPLENLSEMAMYFLVVVFAIGGIVLVVLNIFNVRERKYEVGVLTAIGMKKSRVSLQFIFETLVITLVFVVLGGCIGAVSSVTVTNNLLASQIEATMNESENDKGAFGRDPGFSQGGMPSFPGGSSSGMPSMPNFSGESSFVEDLKGSVDNYVDEVTSATDFGVLLQLLGLGVLLALVASAASVVFITRYDPLKILANRD